MSRHDAELRAAIAGLNDHQRERLGRGWRKTIEKKERTDGKNMRMSRLGAELKKRGIRLGLHQHTPELRNKAHEFHQIFALTEAGTVDFCIDTHWLYRGGVLPMDALQRYGNRVVSWHLRQSRNGIWWEDLDSGDIDYATIAAFAHKQKLPRRFSVELALESGTKLTRNVVENHRRSLDYARKIFTA